MPGLPQHPQLPPEPIGDGPVVGWAGSFQRAWTRLWTELTYVVNGLVKVGTLAERPAEPPIDEIFYYATDEEQGYLAVDGAWVALGWNPGPPLRLAMTTDPAAPAAGGLLYVRDNGAGKAQLVVRFPTGAVQVIATEP